MANTSIVNVLNLLRLIKKTNMPANASIDNLTSWISAGDEVTKMQIAIYIVQQCDEAIEYVDHSQLSEEAKMGLLETVGALRKAFSFGGLNQAISTNLPQIDSSISSFAILASVLQVEIPAQAVSEVNDLIIEVEKAEGAFNDAGIDPLVRATAQRHLHVLLTLLRNYESLGVDSAMAAYSELVIRLRTAQNNSSETSTEKTSGIWETIKTWTARFETIDKLISSGTSLIGAGKSAATLALPFIGSAQS